MNDKDYAEQKTKNADCNGAFKAPVGIIRVSALCALCRYRHKSHWTGHPGRLNRPTLNESYRFGDQNYAREELRAELASVFLAAERGIPHDPANHAAYAASWIKALRDDKNEIFRAAHDASRATEFLLALERDKSVGESLVISPEAAADELEQETAQIQSDLTTEPDLNPAALERDEVTVDETAQTVARLDLNNGRLNVHVNSTGIDYGVPFDPRQLTAERIVEEQLGKGARVTGARTESGIYRGAIIGVTDEHFLQQISAKSVVAHPKELIDPAPTIGQKLAITYSDSQVSIREIRDRAKAQGLTR
jgi:hypothetical protein